LFIYVGIEEKTTFCTLALTSENNMTPPPPHRCKNRPTWWEKIAEKQKVNINIFLDEGHTDLIPVVK
jgi:hypothetical protein